MDDLSWDLNNFTVSCTNINVDISVWYDIILKHLNRHASFKVKRDKAKLTTWAQLFKTNDVAS